MSGSNQIYLDGNATSLLRPAAREVLRAFAEEGGGIFEGVKNPSSIHRQGQRARGLLKEARRNILNLLLGANRHPASESCELFFTSGATEGCNALVFGFFSPRNPPREIVTTVIEHPAMLEPIRFWELQGTAVSYVSPEQDGIVRRESIVSAVSEKTDLVSIMVANNETGAIQPVGDIAQSLRSAGYRGPIVTDATQMLGKSMMTADHLFSSGVTALTISGHKIGAPSGIGAVVLNRSASEICFEFFPQILGGAQEHGRRAGTENLIGAVSFGEVARELLPIRESEVTRISALRDELWRLLSSRLSSVRRLTPVDTADEARALSNTLLVHFPGVRGDDLVVALDLLGLCCSTGSACSSGKQGVSHVVEALGLDRQRAREVVRFSLDWSTTVEDVTRAVDLISNALHRMTGESLTESTRAVS